MRTLTIFCGFALAVSFGCSKKQPSADTRQSAYDLFLNAVGNRSGWSSDERRLIRLGRRAEKEAETLPGFTGAARFERIAERAQRLALPSTEVLRYARRAFDLYVSNDRFLYADRVVHQFGIEDNAQHRDLEIRTYASLENGHVPFASLSDSDEWMRRHPLNLYSALQAYNRAMDQRNFHAAGIVARRFKLPGDRYVYARRTELSEQFEDAVTRGAHQLALNIAENSDAMIPRDRVLEVARRAYESNLRGDQPFEAHKIAAKYNLGELYLRRALDAAFADAVSRGTYQLARQLPSGEFLIIASPR